MTTEIPIKGLHHAAYRCRDSEETREFYEGFLGLPLSCSLEIGATKTGRPCQVLHTFYRMADGSFIAFFEDPDSPHDFKEQHDFDMHLALEVEPDHLLAMLERGKREGRDPRGVADHDFIHSIYFRDPNGYVVELTARQPHHDEATDPSKNQARAILDRWQAHKGDALAG